jgi:O-antigen ligase
MSFAVIIQNYRIALSDKSGKKSLLVVIFFFAIASALAFLQSEIGWRQQLFGNLGRNTGLIFYLSLLLILIYIVYFSDTTLEKTVQKILHICGIASVAYAMLQFFELDPIGWTNPYSNLIGFQGNPNFQSSFLGFYSILLIHNLLNPSETKLKKAYSGSFIILANFLIVVSDSIQGLFVFFTGASIVIAYAIIQFRIRFFFLTYCLSMAVSFILVILGLLQKGPFSFLYQPSVSYRGDYWRASWKMFEDNFLFGLGFSSFGDYYMSYRDTVSQSGIEGRGADTFSNSAHNVFLDIASSGGLLLLVPYCALIVLSVFYFIRSLRNKSLKSESISLFSALWFAYLLQSIISVQFVTLAFWGWVCLGLILNLNRISSSN